MSKLQNYKETDIDSAKKLVPSIILACQRVSSNISNEEILLITNDVVNEFSEVSEDIIKQAIKNGSLGKYGRTFKLNSQEVCFWIREELKEIIKPKPNTYTPIKLIE